MNTLRLNAIFPDEPEFWENSEGSASKNYERVVTRAKETAKKKLKLPLKSKNTTKKTLQ